MGIWNLAERTDCRLEDYPVNNNCRDRFLQFHLLLQLRPTLKSPEKSALTIQVNYLEIAFASPFYLQGATAILG